jgi:hypothetical protein
MYSLVDVFLGDPPPDPLATPPVLIYGGRDTNVARGTRTLSQRPLLPQVFLWVMAKQSHGQEERPIS